MASVTNWSEHFEFVDRSSYYFVAIIVLWHLRQFGEQLGSESTIANQIVMEFRDKEKIINIFTDPKVTKFWKSFTREIHRKSMNNNSFKWNCLLIGLNLEKEKELINFLFYYTWTDCEKGS